MTELALFEFFVRKLPRGRNFLVAAGLEQVLAFIEGTRFTGPELAWLEGTGRFRRRTLNHLANFRVTGETYPSAPQSAVPVANARRQAGPTGGSTVQGAR
jgi:nicotinate phosphoribosyltransferase